MKALPHESALFSSAELAEAIGADLDTINNWVRRGIIVRARIGGRHMPNRLFSADEVYKTALKYELVKFGLPPSSATEAVNSIWKQCDRKDLFDKKQIYAVLFPTNDKWTTILCWQSEPGGGLYKFARSSALRAEKILLPDRAFAVIPISGTLTRIAKRFDSLLEGTRNRASKK
jgi:hypothetical protein